jgi:DNA-directed RNA polymerase specialized sigma subunit
MEGVNEKLTEIEKSISKIETKIEEHDKLLQKQQDKNESQTELNTILKMNVEQMKKITEAIERMDSSISNLGNKQDNFNERLTDVESNIKEQNNEQNINTNKVFKGILLEVGRGIATIIVMYMLLRFGISGGVQK